MFLEAHAIDSFVVGAKDLVEVVIEVKDVDFRVDWQGAANHRVQFSSIQFDVLTTQSSRRWITASDSRANRCMKSTTSLPQYVPPKPEFSNSFHSGAQYSHSHHNYRDQSYHTHQVITVTLNSFSAFLTLWRKNCQLKNGQFLSCCL